jgi:hypothetical protein
MTTLKNASDVLKSAPKLVHESNQARARLVEQASVGLHARGVKRIAKYFEKNALNPFPNRGWTGHIDLLDVKAERGWLTELFGSPLSRLDGSKPEFQSAEGKRLLAPLLKALDDKGYATALAVTDQTYELESGGRGGAWHVTVQLRPKAEDAQG